MGTDDLFKKKQRRRRARKIEHLAPKPDSYLIVCEGEKTEPLYLKELAANIVGELGGRIDVPVIDIEGEGANTISLVNNPCLAFSDNLSRHTIGQNSCLPSSMRTSRAPRRFPRQPSTSWCMNLRS